MRLEYKDVYELANFPKESKNPNTGEKYEPTIKPEHWKTYYCVLELKKDFYSEANCGFMSHENKWYNKGYYVIPCYLSAHKWMCGDKIVLHHRRFCYMFGEPRMYEPQDVKREDWEIAANFKRYWGLMQRQVLDHFGYIENFELYTDVHEAIARAKELDNLMTLTEKWEKVLASLSNETRLYDNLDYKLKRHHAHTERQKLERKMSIMTQNKRAERIDKFSKNEEKLRNEINKFRKYLQY